VVVILLVVVPVAVAVRNDVIAGQANGHTPPSVQHCRPCPASAP
jgi:hypothetical protein